MTGVIQNAQRTESSESTKGQAEENAAAVREVVGETPGRHARIRDKRLRTAEKREERQKILKTIYARCQETAEHKEASR